MLQHLKISAILLVSLLCISSNLLKEEKKIAFDYYLNSEDIKMFVKKTYNVDNRAFLSTEVSNKEIIFPFNDTLKFNEFSIEKRSLDSSIVNISKDKKRKLILYFSSFKDPYLYADLLYVIKDEGAFLNYKKSSKIISLYFCVKDKKVQYVEKNVNIK